MSRPLGSGALPIADLLTLARRAGIADNDLHALLHAGGDAGYIAEDSHGALRLTAPGWRFHRSDQKHYRR